MTNTNDSSVNGDLSADPLEHESIDSLTQAASMVLSMASIDGPPVLRPLAGGANNRVYRVDVPKGSLILKLYFHHPQDSRDRLDAEFAFLKIVWSMGHRNIPQPVARLPLRHLAMYSYIPGDPFVSGDVTQAHVSQAADFVHDINTIRHEYAGQSNAAELITEDRPVMAHASDACFTLAHHLGSIEQRLSRLIAMPCDDDLDNEALAFVQGELSAAWKKSVSHFRSQLQKKELDLHQPVDQGDRVLSPSDFGFHNAVRKSDDSVAFIDFEYAGWDDPAKLICDFFTQVAVPVPLVFWSDFVQRFTACLHGKADVIKRAELLLPLYRIKWCAMALNDFLPVSKDRRAFAQRTGQAVQTEKQSDTSKTNQHAKATQLNKARMLLANLI